MDIGVVFDIRWDWRRIHRLAQIAGEHGYDHIWVSDDPLGRDPFLTLLDIARSIDRIKLGIATVNPSARHPAILAASAATLNHYASRRFCLGLGSSNASLLNPIGLEAEHQARRCHDAVVIIRQLLEEGRSTFSSPLFTTFGARLAFPEVSPVPLLVGTSGGPAMLRISGEVADGIIIPAGNAGLYTYVIDTFRDAYHASRRTAPPHIVLLSNVGVATEPSAAIAAMRPRVAQALAYRAKTPHALRHMGITLEQVQEWKHHPELLPDALIRDAAIVGTPAECVDALIHFATLGVTQLALRFPDETALRQVGASVLPAFRKQRRGGPVQTPR
jgi:alkanesulfonate monooxygenase SsuD/methylene tetrahydromethanopterin reductase-like flavin-dependent oxidoreductase (luciferase family)